MTRSRAVYMTSIGYKLPCRQSVRVTIRCYLFYFIFACVRAPNSGYRIIVFLHAHARAYTCVLRPSPPPPLLLSLLLMTLLLSGSLKLVDAEKNIGTFVAIFQFQSISISISALCFFALALLLRRRSNNSV